MRKEDRWIAPLVQAYSDGLCSDKGGKDNMSYAETAMAELASLARGCVLLVLAAAARGGGIAGARRGTTLTGPGQARTITDPDLAATLARFMAVEAGALKTLGLGRRSKPALSLAEYIEGKAQRTETPS